MDEKELTEFELNLLKQVGGLDAQMGNIEREVRYLKDRLKFVGQKQWQYTSLKCSSCGIQYFLSPKYLDSRQEDHREFYCPNGHSEWYPGVTKEDKLRKKLGKAKTEYEQCKADMENDITDRDVEILELKRSRAAYKGMLTKAGMGVDE